MDATIEQILAAVAVLMIIGGWFAIELMRRKK